MAKLMKTGNQLNHPDISGRFPKRINFFTHSGGIGYTLIRVFDSRFLPRIFFYSNNNHQSNRKD